MKATVREATIVGNTVARDNAKRTSGTHGKHYPKSFTWETSSFSGFGGGEFVGQRCGMRPSWACDSPSGGLSDSVARLRHQ